MRTRVRRAATRAALPAIALAAACGSEAVRTVPAGEPRAGRTPLAVPAPDAAEPPAEEVHASPHGASIQLVALTDAGDAALTVDGLGLIRLWPVLDGTREPLVVRAGPARRIALGRDGGELVAALLDPAGGLELLRLGAAGAVRARARVLGEPAYQELAFAGGVILARASDHAIAALDARGGLRGRLVAGPGERITALVARGRAAAAAIAGGDTGDARALRWIDLPGPGGPRWGATVALPDALATPLAISPGGRYLAGFDGKTRELAVFELAPQPRAVRRGPGGLGPDTPGGIGFLDEQTLVGPDGSLLAPDGAPDGTPDGTGPGTARPGGLPGGLPGGPGAARGRLRIVERFAVSDRGTASGFGGALLLSGALETWYLGYRHSPLGALRPAGALLVLGSGRERLWLDEGLRIVREVTLAGPPGSELALDAAHSVVRTPAGRGEPRARRTELVRHATGRSEPLTPDPGDCIAYEPRTRTLASIAGGEARRWRLELATATVQPVGPALRVRREASSETSSETSIELFDPALAGGVIAMAIAHDDRLAVVHVETFVEPGPRPGARPEPKVLAPASRMTLDGEDVLGVDRRGGVWAMQRGPSRRVTVYRAGRIASRFDAPAGVMHSAVPHSAVDPTGERLALMGDRAVVALAADGTELWRRWAPAAHHGVFSEDGKRLAVVTRGGLLLLDAATGRELAASCGWRFGRSADELRGTILGAPPVCAEGAPP